MSKPKSCRRSKGDDLGAYVEVQGDLDQIGMRWTDSGQFRSSRTREIRSTGRQPGLGPDGLVPGPVNRAPDWVVHKSPSGWSRYDTRLSPGWIRSGARSDRPWDRPGRPGARLAGLWAGWASSSRLFFLFLLLFFPYSSSLFLAPWEFLLSWSLSMSAPIDTMMIGMR